MLGPANLCFHSCEALWLPTIGILGVTCKEEDPRAGNMACTASGAVTLLYGGCDGFGLFAWSAFVPRCDIMSSDLILIVYNRHNVFNLLVLKCILAAINVHWLFIQYVVIVC